jgi:UPF0288 family protein (methanogenesis marker protein 3)
MLPVTYLSQPPDGGRLIAEFEVKFDFETPANIEGYLIAVIQDGKLRLWEVATLPTEFWNTD